MKTKLCILLFSVVLSIHATAQFSMQRMKIEKLLKTGSLEEAKPLLLSELKKDSSVALYNWWLGRIYSNELIKETSLPYIDSALWYFEQARMHASVTEFTNKKHLLFGLDSLPELPELRVIQFKYHTESQYISYLKELRELYMDQKGIKEIPLFDQKNFTKIENYEEAILRMEALIKTTIPNPFCDSSYFDNAWKALYNIYLDDMSKKFSHTIKSGSTDEVDELIAFLGKKEHNLYAYLYNEGFSLKKDNNGGTSEGKHFSHMIAELYLKKTRLKNEDLYNSIIEQSNDLAKNMKQEFDSIQKAPNLITVKDFISKYEKQIDLFFHSCDSLLHEQMDENGQLSFSMNQSNLNNNFQVLLNTAERLKKLSVQPDIAKFMKEGGPITMEELYTGCEDYDILAGPLDLSKTPYIYPLDKIASMDKRYVYDKHDTLFRYQIYTGNIAPFTDNPEDLFFFFNLQSQYYNLSQREAYMKTEEYESYRDKLKSAGNLMKSKYYLIDDLYMNNRKAGNNSNFIKYDYKKKGFNVLFSESEIIEFKGKKYYIPNAIGLVSFNQLPLTEEVNSGIARNEIFIEVPREDCKRMEAHSKTLRLAIVFQVTDAESLEKPRGLSPRYKNSIFWLPYLKAGKSKLVFYDKESSEIFHISSFD